MQAQTAAYGLFAARCRHEPGSGPFTRQSAVFAETTPFLRDVFGRIAGPGIDQRIAWVVDDLARLLDRAEMGAILAAFGSRVAAEDPVVHFYEDFLAAYDPSLREMRGVYYTPEPVVSYIVRSVDRLLHDRFGLADGLATTDKVAAADGGAGRGPKGVDPRPRGGHRHFPSRGGCHHQGVHRRQGACRGVAELRPGPSAATPVRLRTTDGALRDMPFEARPRNRGSRGRLLHAGGRAVERLPHQCSRRGGRRIVQTNCPDGPRDSAGGCQRGRSEARQAGHGRAGESAVLWPLCQQRDLDKGPAAREGRGRRHGQLLRGRWSAFGRTEPEVAERRLCEVHPLRAVADRAHRRLRVCWGS